MSWLSPSYRLPVAFRKCFFRNFLSVGSSIKYSPSFLPFKVTRVKLTAGLGTPALANSSEAIFHFKKLGSCDELFKRSFFRPNKLPSGDRMLNEGLIEIG